MSQVFKSKKIQSRSWSDLPLDILNLIMDRLYYADQIRFRAVCKSWRAIFGDKYADPLPWVMAYEWDENVDSTNTLVSELYDPSHGKKHTIKHSMENKFDYGVFCDSKYGWVLFSNTQHFTRTTSLLFYTPFSNEIMELPKLHLLGFKAATFSVSPASLDCVICVLSIDDRKLYVSTCSPRDQTWSTCQFDGFKYNEVKVKNMVFIDGTFYWIFDDGNALGAFNIALQELNIYKGPVLSKYPRSGYLVESDGHIYYVSRLYIFRFDQLQKNWIEVESLDNLMLFVGYSTLVSSPAEMEAIKLANTIHLDGINCMSYFHKSAADCCCPQIYDWIGTNWMRKIWIQPPQSKV